MPATLVSVQVGQPRHLGLEGAADPFDRPWSSAIFKAVVDGPVWVGVTNLRGDRQSDLTVHGGPEKAVLAYASAHYPAWRQELGIPELGPGGFGENLTLDGLDEHTVAIGDRFRIGDAEVQVSQPRMPCWKLAFKWRRPDLPARVIETGRSGWYFRVLKEGNLNAGATVEVLDRPCPQWTVARIAAIAYGTALRPEEALVLAECQWLTEGWRRRIAQRAAAF